MICVQLPALFSLAATDKAVSGGHLTQLSVSLAWYIVKCACIGWLKIDLWAQVHEQQKE